MPPDALPPEVRPFVPEEFFTMSVESALVPNELSELAGRSLAILVLLFLLLALSLWQVRLTAILVASILTCLSLFYSPSYWSTSSQRLQSADERKLEISRSTKHSWLESALS